MADQTQPAQQAVTTTTAKPLAKKEVIDLIQSDEWREKFRQVIPKHLTVDRLLRTSITAMSKNPDLLKCTQISLMSALMKCTSAGLEPDGYYAHLIPFWNSQIRAFEAVCMFDYKGIRDLAYRSGSVTKIMGEVVYEGDEFDYEFGSHSFLKHKPTKNPKDRGSVIAAYSWVKQNGEETFDVMLKEDVEKIRRRSKSPDKGPWVTDWNEMAKKTVFKRHSKELRLSSEVRDAIHADNEGETVDILTEQTARPELDRPRRGQIAANSDSDMLRQASIDLDKERAAESAAATPPAGATEPEKPKEEPPKEEKKKKAPVTPTATTVPPAESKPAEAPAEFPTEAPKPTAEKTPSELVKLRTECAKAGITEPELVAWAKAVQDEVLKIAPSVAHLGELTIEEQQILRANLPMIAQSILAKAKNAPNGKTAPNEAGNLL